ncbi:hypothetical protein LTR37_005646 [Vermiconidia calcicola]|uniref:Uncharacterized protein n=1 Tax=Vermiconidia calcicola TaxID=1690605 RepID=A0ACC3NIK9_9PEZI|nr:hypothetical protein LTR37_005646 [Vermiconidia calcicola]
MNRLYELYQLAKQETTPTYQAPTSHPLTPPTTPPSAEDGQELSIEHLKSQAQVLKQNTVLLATRYLKYGATYHSLSMSLRYNGRIPACLRRFGAHNFTISGERETPNIVQILNVLSQATELAETKLADPEVCPEDFGKVRCKLKAAESRVQEAFALLDSLKKVVEVIDRVRFIAALQTQIDERKPIFETEKNKKRRQNQEQRWLSALPGVCHELGGYDAASASARDYEQCFEERVASSRSEALGVGCQSSASHHPGLLKESQGCLSA